MNRRDLLATTAIVAPALAIGVAPPKPANVLHARRLLERMRAIRPDEPMCVIDRRDVYVVHPDQEADVRRAMASRGAV
ncbi:hypothetical protein [Thalassobaculum sp.]|uniref:hypothetical protein n=1 Tax=Thalassobaculum sp. TaxID=2022740 RepID=UPI0032F09A82